jgi:hypothetical protein
MAQSASDFLSSQLTCGRWIVSPRCSMGGAQCEAHCSRIDKVAAIEGQPDVDMVLWLPAFLRGLCGPGSPVGGMLWPLSGCHDAVVDIGMGWDGWWMADGMIAGMPVEWPWHV